MNFITKAPVMLRGGDYNPDQWLDRPDILEADIRMMKKAGMNSVTLGVFAWAAYEPREGEYNFTWLREIMDRLYDQGIYTELATPTGAKPNWLARKYPEVLRVQSNGVRDHQGMRHNHCLTSPIYRQKVEELLNHLIDAVGDHPGLILWHISNELGGECYCPLCQERFRGWLKEKYHTIDALNHAWWTSFWSHHYDSFDEVEPPFDNGEQSLNGLKLDWRRFTTWNMMDYVHSETAILRKRTPNVPITTNLMEYFPGLDYHKLQRELDFVCWDSYPHWGRPDRSTTVTAGMTAFDHALIRGCKPDKPFLLMESTPSLVNWHEYNKLKRPGVNRMSAIQTVACGADGVQYFQWRKGRGGTEQGNGENAYLQVGGQNEANDGVGDEFLHWHEGQKHRKADDGEDTGGDGEAGREPGGHDGEESVDGIGAKEQYGKRGDGRRKAIEDRTEEKYALHLRVLALFGKALENARQQATLPDILRRAETHHTGKLRHDET